MNKLTKQQEYTLKIKVAIESLFNSDNENGFKIDQNEFQDEQNIKDFMQALLNSAPSMVFNKITGQNKNWLEVNHIANQLLFEYMNKEG